MEILELENIITKIKNSMDKLNSRMEGKEELEQKTRGVREVGCLGEGSEAEDGGLPSPQVSSRRR